MVSDRDIYASANLLIKQHGGDAENVAQEKMLGFMDKDDAKAAAVWLAITNAISDLRMRERQKYLY